jgi:hypothetical protein
MSRLLSLYPRSWRDRYELEFRALIDQRPPSLADRFDVVRGALDAHLHPQVRRGADRAPEPSRPEADLRVARRLGLGAIAGAAVWVAAFAVASVGPIRYDGDGAYRDGSSALLLLILAAGLLTAGLVGQFILLPATARLARLGAGAAIPFLILWALAPWLWWFGLLVLLGLLALAVGGRLSGIWPTRYTVTVVLACAAVVAVVAFGFATLEGDRLAGAELLGYAGAALVPAWLGVGATLIQRPG